VKLDLRHLEVVIAVADAGSISRAAAALKIAQPGLSAQLRRIERGVGDYSRCVRYESGNDG
jgi:DNA-binding transcriptional LysR family regulator